MRIKLPEELQYIQNSLLQQKTTNARLDGKVCVISGTTTGIGYHAAKRLAQGGAHLVMICRNEKKARRVQEELMKYYGTQVECVLADFQELAQVRRAALEIKKRHPKIDILINNAGVFNRRRRLTPDGNEMTFGVIHLAAFLLTHTLTVNLINGAPSRVIDINSEAHRFGGLNLKDLNWKKRIYIGLRAYAAAKIAQIHTALAFSEQLKGNGVTVNIMHPGAVRSNIGMNNGILYRLYVRFILRWFLKDPQGAAESIYYLAADPGLAQVTGKYFNQTTEEKPAWYAVKSKESKAVWEQTITLVRPYLEES